MGEGSLRQRIQQLEAALPDPRRLEMAADWFDVVDKVAEASARLSGESYKPDPEIQIYLRQYAARIRAIHDQPTSRE